MSDEVFIHLTDTEFSSRCALQDCYVVPVTPADDTNLARAELLSPFMLRASEYINRHRLRQVALLWRCGGCGREQSVMADIFPRKESRRSKKYIQKGQRVAATGTHTDATMCPDCYSCPRCNAPALVMSLTKQKLYIASCPYCEWRSEAHAESLQELLAALDARSPQRVLASYHTTLKEWTQTTEERKTRADMESVSISRLAIEEYNPSASDSRHRALVLEEIRNSIRKRHEKVPVRRTSLRECTLEPLDQLDGAIQAEPHAGVVCLGEDPDDKSKEGEGQQNEEEDDVVVLQDNTECLTHLTQMEQSGFSVHSSYPAGENSQKCDTGVLIRANPCCPVLATVLSSSESDGRGGDSEIVVVNGIDCDPSFPRIHRDIPTRLGRRLLVTLQLAAAVHLPVLLYSGHAVNTGEMAERRCFVWRNLGETDIVVRRLCVAREVGGTFDVSLTVPHDAGEGAWIRIAPQESVPFTVTHHRSWSGPNERNVMVGLLLEVLTQLPVPRGNSCSGPPHELTDVRLLQRLQEEKEGGAPLADENTADLSQGHVVEYGQTIVW